jgi:hypothetical protein
VGGWVGGCREGDRVREKGRRIINKKSDKEKREVPCFPFCCLERLFGEIVCGCFFEL